MIQGSNQYPMVTYVHSVGKYECVRYPSPFHDLIIVVVIRYVANIWGLCPSLIKEISGTVLA